jgi:hypothetical protein
VLLRSRSSEERLRLTSLAAYSSGYTLGLTCNEERKRKNIENSISPFDHGSGQERDEKGADDAEQSKTWKCIPWVSLTL